MFPKPITERDSEYLDFIRQQPCLVCNRPSSEAHHQPERYNGKMGDKCSDYRAIPLCFDHHVGRGTKLQLGSFHTMSWPFYDRYEIDVETVIVRLNMRYFFG